MVGYEDGTMRIWDLKQGTSLHVLKGREEVNHLGCSLIGEQPLPVGSDLSLGGEVALEPGAGFPCPHRWLLLAIGMLAELGKVVAAGGWVLRLTRSLWGGRVELMPLLPAPQARMATRTP